MPTKATSNTGYAKVHVEGRTPGPLGKAPMVTLENGVASPAVYTGSHHEAVYLAAIIALADALQNGVGSLAVTSPSEHLVEQLRGNWDVGIELRPYYEILKMLEAMFVNVTWGLAPRTNP